MDILDATIRVQVRLKTVGPEADVRTISFRRLPDPMRPGRLAWATDALVAVRYGNGRTVYPRAIWLQRDPPVNGDICAIGSRQFPDMFGADARIVGCDRRGPEDASAFWPSGDETHWDRNWVTESERAVAGAVGPFGIHHVGRFTIRVVPAGGLLFSGTSMTHTREPRDYERDHVIIEIYDARYEHSALGQFVTSYGADTLAKEPGPRRLSLMGGVPSWTMDENETAALVILARRAAA